MMQGISGYLPGFYFCYQLCCYGWRWPLRRRPTSTRSAATTAFENDLSEIRVELRTLYKEHAEFKESARAGSEAIISFSQRITDNRQLILDNTTLRWTSAQQDKYQREQAARDESQERRLMLLERDVDKLGGRQ